MTDSTAPQEDEYAGIDPALTSVSPLAGMKITIGKALWEQGGTADRSLQYGLRVIQRVMSNPVMAEACTVEIRNPNPRSLGNLRFTDDMETLDADGHMRFITPCIGVVEGDRPLARDWKMAIIPTDVFKLADLATAYAAAETDESRAKIRGEFDDVMLGINIYPMCDTLEKQIAFREKHGLKPLTKLDAMTSHKWAEIESDVGNAQLMADLRQRISGLPNVTAIIGEEGSEQRKQYVQWYGDALMKRLNGAVTDNDLNVTPPQGRDLARVICATLDKGDITVTPRAYNPAEVSVLVRLSGFARIYERSKMPKTSREIPTAEKRKLGGPTWVKVPMVRKGPSVLEIADLRPLGIRLVGNADERDAQEVVMERDKHKRLRAIAFSGSSVAKRLRFFGLLLPETWTDMGAENARREEMAMPATVLVFTARAAPKG